MFEPIKDHEFPLIIPGCILSLPAKCYIPKDKFIDPRLPREVIDYKQVMVMVTHVPENLKECRWVNVVLAHNLHDHFDLARVFPPNQGARSNYSRTGRVKQLPSLKHYLSGLSQMDTERFHYFVGLVNYTVDIDVLRLKINPHVRVYVSDRTEFYRMIGSEDLTYDHRQDFQNWRDYLSESTKIAPDSSSLRSVRTFDSNWSEDTRVVALNSAADALDVYRAEAIEGRKIVRMEDGSLPKYQTAQEITNDKARHSNDSGPETVIDAGDPMDTDISSRGRKSLGKGKMSSRDKAKENTGSGKRSISRGNSDGGVSLENCSDFVITKSLYSSPARRHTAYDDGHDTDMN